MRVILETSSDAATPRRTCLTAGQSLTIGRTEWAEWAIPDQRMSDVHFSLTLTSDTCQLNDLGSTNGTFLNEKKIAESLLRDGDTIRAGGTVFSVRIEGAPLQAPREDREDPAGNLPLMGSESQKAEPSSAAAPPPHTADVKRQLDQLGAVQHATLAIDRVALVVREGPSPIKRVLLRPGESVTWGRTEEADYTVALDCKMSSRHFAVECGLAACVLRDLGSTNGTFVNGQRVKSAALSDQDRITAGQSTFQITIEGRPETVPTRYAGDHSGPEIAHPAPQHGLAPDADLLPASSPIFSREVCDSGVVAVRGCQKLPAAAEVARLLSSKCPLYLVADLRRLGRPAPENSSGYDFLIDWVPKDAQERYSPLVFGNPDESLTLIQQCWGKDGLVAVFSQAERPKLLAHLRLLAGAFARPSILAPQLARAAPVYAANVLAETEGVLVEDQGPGGWMLLLRGDCWLLAVLSQLGFRQQPAAGV